MQTKKRKGGRNVLKKTVPLYAALALTLNTSIGVALIQRYTYKREIADLIAYKENLDKQLANTPEKKAERLGKVVLPEEGVNIGVKWEDLGKKLVDAGVIDKQKFLNLFKFPKDRSSYENLLSNSSSEYIVLNEANSRFVLNVLWALGLVQASNVLTDMETQFENVENLASTGGWSIGTAEAMKFYGKEDILSLSKSEQNLVASIAKNIYRPCCNNNTAFPDCNHGMAMLGLIELMVANGYSESEIYNTALKVNSYWFPDTYMTIADYFETKENTAWGSVDAKLALSDNFSSGSGYRNIKNKVQTLPSSSSGGGCGV